jgi:hypothetical protein
MYNAERVRRGTVMVSDRSAILGRGDSRVQLAHNAPKNGKADEQCRKSSPAHMVSNSTHSIPKDIKKIQYSLTWVCNGDARLASPPLREGGRYRTTVYVGTLGHSILSQMLSQDPRTQSPHRHVVLCWDSVSLLRHARAGPPGGASAW